MNLGSQPRTKSRPQFSFQPQEKLHVQREQRKHGMRSTFPRPPRPWRLGWGRESPAAATRKAIVIEEAPKFFGCLRLQVQAAAASRARTAKPGQIVSYHAPAPRESMLTTRQARSQRPRYRLSRYSATWICRRAPLHRTAPSPRTARLPYGSRAVPGARRSARNSAEQE